MEETEVKDIEWLKETLEERIDTMAKFEYVPYSVGLKEAYQHTLLLINQLDEPEVLSQEWIDENKVARINNLRKMTTRDVVPVEKLKNLLVPKQEEVDLAYKDGYEKGKEYTFYKGYLEGLGDKEKEPETVASVMADFFGAAARLKEVLAMEVEELEE